MPGNKSPPSPAALDHSEHLSSHSFGGSGTQAQPTWWFWQGCRQAVSQAPLISRFSWGWRAHLQSLPQADWRPPLLTDCWAEASVLPHVGNSVGLLAAQQLASTRPNDPREDKKEIKVKKHKWIKWKSVFYNLMSKRHTIASLQTLLATERNSVGGCPGV